MILYKLPFSKTDFSNQLVLDYLSGKESLQNLHNGLPTNEAVLASITRKKFDPKQREILVSVLNNQYKGIHISELVQSNINTLASPNCFTITTGQQLGLLGGPLYTLYKILHLISCVQSLNNNLKDQHFVPVFWLQSEDHDIKEIDQHFLFNQKYVSDANQAGIAGDLLMELWKPIIEQFDAKLTNELNWQSIKSIYNKALAANNWSLGFRIMLNEIFGSYGLVVLEPRAMQLKSEFKQFIIHELEGNGIYNYVNHTNTEIIKLGYTPQAYVRPINLFMFKDGLRLRIEYKDQKYFLLDSDYSYSKAEILKLANEQPELFSPNVLLRPLYQELILPNLIYIGGGAEVAYWLQLKNTFEQNGIAYPFILMRNSVMIINSKQSSKMQKFHIDHTQLFDTSTNWSNHYLGRSGETTFSLTDEKRAIEKMYNGIIDKVKLITTGLNPTIEAERNKTIQSLTSIEEKFSREIKKKSENEISQINNLKESLFPNGTWPERIDGLADFWIKNGPDMIHRIINDMNVFTPELHLYVDE